MEYTPRILPIANPDSTHNSDNVLSEETLTTLRKSFTDTDSYLLDIGDNGNAGYFFKCVISGYYIEGEMWRSEFPSNATYIVLYLNRDNNDQVTSVELSSKIPQNHKDYLKLLLKESNAWIVNKDSYYRSLPRSINTNNGLILCCGTASQFKE